MVAALPVQARKEVCNAREGRASIELESQWRILTGEVFYCSPSFYVAQLKEAGRQGTLDVVNELLKQGDKQP